METVREFTHIGDRMSAGGGCEAAATAISRCVWVKFKKCGYLLNKKRFLIKLIGLSTTAM